MHGLTSARRVFRWIIVFVLTLVLLVVLPIVTLVAILLNTLRFAAIKYAKHFRPDLAKILSTRSAIFATDDLYGNPKANIIVTIVRNRNGTHVLQGLKQEFLEAMNKKSESGEYVHPEFQQYLSSFLGFPFWKWDKNFNIDYHFKVHPIPVLTQETINELSTEYLKAPFVRGRSPWEVIGFDNAKLNPDDSDEPRTAIFFRCHHSLGDGFSITSTLLKFSEPLPALEDGKPQEKLKEKFELPLPPKPRQKSAWKKLGSIIRYVVFAPFEFVNAMIESWDVNQCHISQNKLSPSPLLAFSGRVPIQFIKEIKRAHGTGFTTVLLAAFTGAVRSFMVENGYKIPDVIHSVTPFAMPGHSYKLRNFMTSCFIRLPTGLSTAEERLLAIDKHLKDLKRSTHPITMFYILALVGSLPSWLAKVFFQQNGPTALISNFPGPQQEVHYLGRPLEDIMFTAGLLPGRIGIGFCALSYNGNVRIQAAFNDALASKNMSRTFLLDKVLQELQILAEKHTA